MNVVTKIKKRGSKENISTLTNVVTKIKKSGSKRDISTLTVDHLASAIRASIDSEGMPKEQARSMAQHVMNFFGYSERIIDNVLEPEDRDAFYMLEDAGILTTEREETTLYDGREWRIHYWIFRKERIAELLGGSVGILGDSGDSSDVYKDIPPETWTRE